MPEQCPWCGARESSLGRLSKPSEWHKFSCATVSERFGRLCHKRPVFGCKTYWEAHLVELYCSVLRESLKVLMDARTDCAFMAGDQWPSKGMKIGDTIQVRRPTRFHA